MPLQIAGVSFFLYRLLDAASFAGFGVIFPMFIMNQFFATGIYSLYMAFMKSKDARMKLVSEAFKSITVVKFNAWEDQFLSRIGDARAKEVENIWKFMRFQASMVMLTWGLPVFISVAAFSVYTGAMRKQLTPSVVFTSIALFQLIRTPLAMIPSILGAIVQAKGSLERILRFLSP